MARFRCLPRHLGLAVLATVLLLGRVSGAQSSGDTPFSDAVARSVVAVFDTTRAVTLNGVITAPIIRINRASARYFAIEVRTADGAATSWAILLRKAGDDTLIVPGASMTVTGWAAKDGSHRLESSLEKIRPILR